MSINFQIDKLSEIDETCQKIIEENDVTMKLCISTCGSISKSHLILRYDIDREIFEFQPLSSLNLNDTTVMPNQEFIPLNPMDKLHFFCDKCYLPHLFYFIVPTKDQMALKEGIVQ